ncbi:MAG: M24 family metallopeptidase [Chloroflexota bacterium]
MNNVQLVSEKIEQAIEILNKLDIDLWLLFVRETSMAPDPALELIYGGDVTWQTAFLFSRSGEKIVIVGDLDSANLHEMGVYSRVIGYHEGLGEILKQEIERLDPQSIAINYSEGDVAGDGLSFGMYRILTGYLAGTPYADRLISAEKLNFHLRGRKSPAEIERIRQAVKTTEMLFDEIEKHVKPGMTQQEISQFVHAKIDGMGLGYAWPKPYNPIVTCGPYSPIGHAAPGAVVLEKGHLLHIDLGIRENEYSSDIQRMWYVLKDGETEAPPEVQRAFMVVHGAILAGEQYLTPGTPGYTVDEVAREFIVDNGYPEYMHAFGHMMGRVAHDGGTVLGPQWERYKGSCELEIEVGNVFTLELHVVVEGRGMMSLEEDVVVTSDGVEYLSTPQTAIRYIR